MKTIAMKMKNSPYTAFRLWTMLLAAVGLAAAATGCVNEESPADPRLPVTGGLAFRAELGSSILATRFGEVIPVVPADFGEEIFYIYERGTSLDQNDPNRSYHRASVRPYWLASGSQGELEVASAAQFEEWSQSVVESGETQVDKKSWELNWFASNTEHEFWSWTWPLQRLNYSEVQYNEEKGADEVFPNAEGLPLTFISSDFPLPNYDDEDESGKARAIGTRDEGTEEPETDPDPVDPDPVTPVDPATTWRNGEALERLVGAKTDRSYIFNQDGRYVPLTYKHLVSKIILGDFWLYDNTGATQKNLKALITFYGMPKRAMFYPYPNPVEGGEVPAPYVTIDHSNPYGTSTYPTPEDKATGAEWKYDRNQYLTFYIMNEGNHEDNSGGLILDDDYYRGHDAFYICPEIDFSELEYKVEFYEAVVDKETNRVLGYQLHPRYGVRGGYFGDFKNVEFRREIGTDENGNPIYDPHPTDDHVLHAGEVMILNMKVYEKSGPGVGVWIRNWSTENLKSATYHKHPGIYSDADAAAVRSGYWYKSPSETYDGRKGRAAELYGETEVNEKTGKETTVIRMYSDITFACYDSNVGASNHYHFRLYPESDKDVILDGMGYTISFVEQYAPHTQPHEYFYIGNVRDVYVTNGETTIYFDDKGQICRWDEETGKYKPTGESWTPNDTPIYFEKKA